MLVFGALGNLQHEKDKFSSQNIWLRKQKESHNVIMLQEFPSACSWCTETAKKKLQKLMFKEYILGGQPLCCCPAHSSLAVCSVTFYLL